MVDHSAKMHIATHNGDVMNSVPTYNGKSSSSCRTEKLSPHVSGPRSSECWRKVSLPSLQIGFHLALTAVVQKQSGRDAHVVDQFFIK